MRRAGSVTHLVGPVDLSGRPAGVLHVVLLHLGADFGAGGDVAGRLRGDTLGALNTSNPGANALVSNIATRLSPPDDTWQLPEEKVNA